MATIDIPTAREMVELYTEERRTIIDAIFKIRDTRAIWFSKEELEEFVAGLTPDITGVRFYLAVNKEDAVCPGQTTIILIGTVDKDGKNVDPVGDKGLQCTEGGGQDPFNHGNLCPPGHDCVS